MKHRDELCDTKNCRSNHSAKCVSISMALLHRRYRIYTYLELSSSGWLTLFASLHHFRHKNGKSTCTFIYCIRSLMKFSRLDYGTGLYLKKIDKVTLFLHHTQQSPCVKPLFSNLLEIQLVYQYNPLFSRIFCIIPFKYGTDFFPPG